MKTYADQTHDGTVTLEAYDNFANVIIAPEGLEINFDWKPLANTSGVATNTTHLHANGDVVTTAFNPEEVTLLDETEFNAHLGPYGTLPSGDDIYLSSNSSVRSNGKGNGTLYPSVNANPFFPAIAGTHKDIADTDNNITGTQPGSLTANDIYAGSYTQIDTGGVDPGTVGSPLDYRFVIQNDLKWVYATSPFAANSSGSSSTYNVPQAAAYQSLFDGSLDGEIGAVSGQSADGTSGSTVVAIPADVAGTCSANTHINNTQVTYTTGTVGARSNMVMVTSQTCVGSAYFCYNPSGSTPGGGWTSGTCASDATGSWEAGAGAWSGTAVEFSCLFNRVQYVMTSAGGALSVGSTSGMETNFAIFYQLLLDLISASYGKDYTDPVELTAAGSYTELGRSDASLKTAVETMKSRVDTVIGLHNTERSNVATRIGTSFSHPGAYKTAVDLMISYLAKFQSAVGNRILEISNRIGYLNGKNVASGGSNFISSVVDYLLLNGTDGSSTNEGDNILCEDVLDNDLVQMESEVSASISVGSAGDGFAGYSFNGGSGYANTMYSHANFLAGKKIKLVQKILQAVEDVSSLYNQIKSKRSEYYEYNQ
jgi:hypothetical protein